MPQASVDPQELDLNKLRAYVAAHGPKTPMSEDRLWWWAGLKWFRLYNDRLVIESKIKGTLKEDLEYWLETEAPFAHRYESIRRVSYLTSFDAFAERPRDWDGPLPFKPWLNLTEAEKAQLRVELPPHKTPDRQVLVPFVDDPPPRGLLVFGPQIGIKLDADDASIIRGVMSWVRTQRRIQGIEAPKKLPRRGLDLKPPSWRGIELLDGAGEGPRASESRRKARKRANAWRSYFAYHRHLWMLVRKKLNQSGGGC